MQGSDRQRREVRDGGGDEGFMLVAVIVAIFLILLVLSIAAPRLAMRIKRDREVESAHRANQYVRAIQLYYLKFKQYPTSLEQLKKTNNVRYLREEYVDPLTGQADWRLIHVGENKSTVKDFFGEDFKGPAPGLGSASGMQSPSPTTPPTTTKGGSSGAASQDATTFKGGGGPIMGVGSSKSGSATLVVNEQTTYQDWEFLYDPRTDERKKNVSIFGGGIPTGGSSSGLGSASGIANPPPPPPGDTGGGSPKTPDPPK